METESITVCENTIDVKPIVTMKDFMNMTDSIVPESEVIASYQTQISTIDNENKLPVYVEDLKGMKGSLTLKRNAYAGMISGKASTKDYWDTKLLPYYKKIGFKPDPVEFLEDQLIKTKDGKTETKQILKVRVDNCLKNATKHNLPHVLNTLLTHFKLEEEVEIKFRALLETVTATNHADIEAGHLIKEHSELYNDSKDVTLTMFDIQSTQLDIYLQKTGASIDFINWKLKQIKVYENEKKFKSSTQKLLDLEEKLKNKLKNDSKFASLHNIVKQWSL